MLAADRAVATGEPTLTRKTTLVQDQQQNPGWVCLLPVYRTGGDLSTPAQRQALLVGVLFAPMVVSEVLQGAAEATQGQADFELVDAAQPTASSRF